MTDECTFIQAGAGAVERTCQDKMRDTLDLFDYLSASEKADALSGAPVIDLAAKLQAVVDMAAMANQKLDVRGTLRIDSKLVLKGDADFSQSTIHVHGSPSIAIEISTGGAANPVASLNCKTIVLPNLILNKGKPALGWVGQGVGVRVVNALACRVWFSQVQGFATGIQITAFGVGTVFSDFFLGRLIDNQVGIDLAPGDSSGYVNDNNFYNGRPNISASEGVRIPGARHIRISAASHPVNNNVFYKPCVEGIAPEYHIENNGSYNTFIGGRYEGDGGDVRILYSGNGPSTCANNLILGGYGAEAIKFAYDGVGAFTNMLFSPRLSEIYSTVGGGAVRMCCSSVTSPALALFANQLDMQAATGTNYMVNLSPTHLLMKRAADEAPRIDINGDFGRISCLGGVGVFNSSPPASKPSVTGSRSSGAALASLLNAMASYGFIADNTTA